MVHDKKSDEGDNDEVIFIGLVLFSIQLSKSFAFFTIKRNVGDNLDVIVRTVDSVTDVHLTSIVEEVQRCWDFSEPIRVYGKLPFEKSLYGCSSACFKAFNVNELPILVPSHPLCQVIKWTPVQQQIAREKATWDSNGKRKRVNVNNYARAARFVEFLVNEFGHTECLGKSSVGVLDVAGGSGAVTFELSAMRNIPSTVIDPRPVKLNSKQRKTLLFRQKCGKLLRPGLGVSKLAQAMTERYREWQPSQAQCLFNAEFSQTDEGDALLRNCTCVVGMHPDEATDEIMDLAIHYNKPFALVPCCVFPKLFSKRRLITGESVRSYEDLCNYIMERTENVQQATLDFDGRNKVFFWVPPEE